jgi:hypothetical protein
MPEAFRNVGLFVDWNSQLRLVPDNISDDPVQACRHAINAVGKTITRYLCALDKVSRYRVRVRLYHGWTAGIMQTVNRRAVEQIPEYLSPDDIFPSVRVLSQSDIEFGDRLIDGLAERQLPRSGIHLPNTLRRQGGQQGPTEKMVDTALAADLLSWARSEPTSIAIVVSPDDDMVPPVFVAEAWMKPFGGVVRLARSPARGDSRFLLLDGLLT